MTVYPDEEIYAVVGQSASLLNAALTSWATLIRENTDRLRDLGPEDWHVLADAWRICQFDASWPNVSVMMGGMLEDAHRMRRIGDLHYGKDPSTADALVRQLALYIRTLSYVEAWAAILTVRFYLENRLKIEDGDRWWTIAYRIEFHKNARRKARRGRKPKLPLRPPPPAPPSPDAIV